MLVYGMGREAQCMYGESPPRGRTPESKKKP
jgi:hypothetical protein